MKSNYKKLGEFIRQVDIRNIEGKENNLLGVSVQKTFIPSIANTVGTDFTKYKVVKRNQFTYIPDTSRRGDKIGIAYLKELDEGLVSNVYTVFEVIDENKLNPEYLMLWFSRPEFDRYARFKSHGSVREVFDWEQMCNVELPIPPIEKQNEIVSAYNAISNRIVLKRQINENLAETAQTIFKHTFIEPTQDGFPSTWTKVPLFQVADLGAGGDRPDVFSNIKTPECSIPIFSNGIESEGLYGYTDKAKVYSESVTISARGTVGYVFLRQEPFVPIVRLIYITPKNNRVTAKYLYFALRYAEMNSTGTSQQQITVPDFKDTPITVPDENTMILFMHQIEPLFDEINRNKDEIVSLQSLQTVILQTISSR